MRFFKKLALAAFLTVQAQSVEDGSALVKQPRATWRELLQIMNKDEDDTSPSILARGKKNSATGAAGWGRQPKNKFVEYKTCPMLETPKNAKGVFCDGATCVVDCLAGFMPAGNPRVNCVRNKAPKFVEKGENRWNGVLPDCQACEELPPIVDQNIDQFCFVNARDNQMTCEHQCTNGGKLTGMKGSALRCVCNQQGACGWSRKAKKAKFADTSKVRCTDEFVLPPQRSSCEEKSILEFSTEAARITNSNDCKKCKLLALDTQFPATFDSDDTVILELSQPLKSVGTFSFPIVSAELAEDQTAITLTFYEYADMSEKDVRMFLNIESKRKSPEVIGITTRPCSAKRSEFSVSPNSKGGGYGSTTSSFVSTTGTTTSTAIDGSGIYSANGGNGNSYGGSSGPAMIS